MLVKLTWRLVVMSDDSCGQVDDFLKAAHDQAKGYASDHIIMTMGEDFNYQSGDMWYKNLDKLIWYDSWLRELFAVVWMNGLGLTSLLLLLMLCLWILLQDLGMFLSPRPLLCLF